MSESLVNMSATKAPSTSALYDESNDCSVKLVVDRFPTMTESRVFTDIRWLSTESPNASLTSLEITSLSEPESKSAYTSVDEPFPRLTILTGTMGRITSSADATVLDAAQFSHASKRLPGFAVDSSTTELRGGTGMSEAAPRLAGDSVDPVLP